MKYLYIIIILHIMPYISLGQNNIEVKSESPIRFQIPVNTASPNDEKEAIYENDYGVIILPKSYSQNGKPVPLVIGCHGGGGTVTGNSSQTENYDLYRYLVSIGYAVMDVAGMPESYSKRLKIDHNRCMGSFVAVRSYNAAYKWATNNFNIDTGGVYLSGGSNGGLTAVNITSFSNIPIVCQANMSPLLSMSDQAWNIPTGSVNGGEFEKYQNRANIIRIYGMNDVHTIEALLNAEYDVQSVGEFDPFAYNMYVDQSGDSVKKYNTPLKIWHPINDHILPIKYSRSFVRAINHSGGVATLVEMEGGGHGPEYYGESIGYFLYQKKRHELKKSVYELASWFAEFSKIEPQYENIN